VARIKLFLACCFLRIGFSAPRISIRLDLQLLWRGRTDKGPEVVPRASTRRAATQLPAVGRTFASLPAGRLLVPHFSPAPSTRVRSHKCTFLALLAAAQPSSTAITFGDLLLRVCCWLTPTRSQPPSRRPHHSESIARDHRLGLHRSDEYVDDRTQFPTNRTCRATGKAGFFRRPSQHSGVVHCPGPQHTRCILSEDKHSEHETSWRMLHVLRSDPSGKAP